MFSAGPREDATIPVCSYGNGTSKSGFFVKMWLRIRFPWLPAVAVLTMFALSGYQPTLAATNPPLNSQTKCNTCIRCCYGTKIPSAYH